MRTLRLLAMTATLVGFSLLTPAFSAIEKISPDPKAVKLVSDTLAALAKASDAERIQALKPLLHKSMWLPGGNDLEPNVKNFSYKKAAAAAKLYKHPADIYEVHQGTTRTIGFKTTAETGRVDKYFVNKNEGVAGRPAPIHVFWPQSGGDPKVTDIGSL